MRDLASSRDGRPLSVLLQNRTQVGGREVRVSIYDTDRPAEAVSLKASHLMFCGMISGRTILHTEGADAPFEFVPGASVVVPPGHQVHIDFPDAQPETPTTSITLEIGSATVQRILDSLTKAPFSSVSSPWEGRRRCLHVANPSGVERVLRTLVNLFSEDHPHRDALIDVNATELVLRMLRTEARGLLLEQHPEHASAQGTAAAVQYVHNHLDRPLSVEELAEAACMGRSTFYRKFRDEVGVTPLQYVNQQRLDRARTLLWDADHTVTDVCLALGFRSVSHFITRFKQSVGLTPKAYQERVQGKSETDERRR